MDYLLAVMRAWYADENALFRQKMTAMMIKRATPWLGAIIRQGVRDGAFTTPYPDQVAEVIYSMMLGLGDAFVDLILGQRQKANQDGRRTDENIRRAQTVTAAYTDALERVLGVPTGSLELMDARAIEQWAMSTSTTSPQSQQEDEHVSIVGNGKGH
jgi:hypothetical protein